MKNNDPAKLLSDLAYERILQALFDSRLPMGEKLNQGDLIKITGIPVGPVRDALKLLEADGIVIIRPRSGIEIISPSTDLVRATFQFRAMIERPAVRAYAMSAREKVLRDLDHRHSEVADQIARVEPNEIVSTHLDKLEDAFHLSMVAALDNELVDASYRRLRLMAQIIKVNTRIFPRAAMVSIREHRAVLKACLERDAEAAEAALAQHLTNALNRNLGFG
ncbi:MAG: GntR family transcriptional regulator [Devosia sp.]